MLVHLNSQRTKHFPQERLYPSRQDLHSILYLDCGSGIPLFNPRILKWSLEGSEGRDQTINSDHIFIVEYTKRYKYHVDFLQLIIILSRQEPWQTQTNTNAGRRRKVEREEETNILCTM